MFKIRKLGLKLLLFICLLGIANTIFPGTFSIFTSPEVVYAMEEESTNPILLDAIENIRIYSTYNYQTLNDTKLNQLSTGFYLPLTYGEVELTWEVDNQRIVLDENVQSITVSSVTGDVVIDVIEGRIVSLPNAFAGNDPFVLTATLFFWRGKCVRGLYWTTGSSHAGWVLGRRILYFLQVFIAFCGRRCDNFIIVFGRNDHWILSSDDSSYVKAIKTE